MVEKSPCFVEEKRLDGPLGVLWVAISFVFFCAFWSYEKVSAGSWLSCFFSRCLKQILDYLIGRSIPSRLIVFGKRLELPSSACVGSAQT